MSEIAILVEGLSKQYRIGGKKQRYKTFGETLSHAARIPLNAANAVLRRNRDAQDEHRTIWSLKDVTFKVNQGNVIGIVGRNGAGKSTLLKILSRITEPTEGYAKVYGRLGSLLEVGTGFHPELTGRENIYLNGAILGMRRTEIDRKFDEIVAFAEVEEFIDTPVKHYSSGMGLRLGFAVAAHLELENLLVDEVLAVGDVAFQKKCLDKMGSVSETGKTILFVSHQLHTIRRLCPQTIWLHNGEVMQIGETAQVLNEYEAAMISTQRDDLAGADGKSGFLRWGIVQEDGELSAELSEPEDLAVRFDFVVRRPVQNGKFRVTLQNVDGLVLWGNTISNLELDPGHYSFTYQFPYLPLKPGMYHWICRLFDVEGWIDQWEALPGMSLTTNPLNLARFERDAGILNMPFEFSVDPMLEEQV